MEIADALSGSPASLLLDLTYFYGGVTSGTTTKNNGNPTQIGIATRQTPSSSVVGFTQTFSYDSLNRLAGVSDTGGWSQTLGYDRYGNMSGTQSGLTGVPALPSSGSYDATTNRLTSSGVGYDAGGNQTVLGSATLSYDGENRQSIDYDSLAVTTVDYAYDGLGQRVSKTVVGGSGSTTYVHDALGNLAAEYTTSTEAPPCTTCYLSWDHLGSTRMVTDQSGNVVANGRHDFLPFGYEIPAGVAGRTTGVWGGPDYLSAKFTGQERDTESGFDNFPARYMASVQGRFMSVDPGNAGASVGSSQSLNMYSYVRNNPMRYIDPSGLFSLVPCDADGVNPNDGSAVCASSSDTVSISVPPGQCYQVVTDGQNTGEVCNSTGNPIALPTQPVPGTPPLSKPPGPRLGCGTVLPNGQTIGDIVRSQRSQLKNTASISGGDDGTGYLPGATGAILAIAESDGPIDFKNNFRGQGNPATLGRAGNFAYYAIGAGILPDFELDAGAGLYGLWSAIRGRKPFSQLTGRMFSDASAASVRDVALASNGCQ